MTAFEKRLLIIVKLMACDSPMPRSEIEDLIGLNTGATLNILNELIKSGFVKRERRNVTKAYLGYVATIEAREWFKF